MANVKVNHSCSYTKVVIGSELPQHMYKIEFWLELASMSCSIFLFTKPTVSLLNPTLDTTMVEGKVSYALYVAK